jgi:hypothetical protein
MPGIFIKEDNMDMILMRIKIEGPWQRTGTQLVMINILVVYLESIWYAYDPDEGTTPRVFIIGIPATIQE